MARFWGGKGGGGRLQGGSEMIWQRVAEGERGGWFVFLIIEGESWRVGQAGLRRWRGKAFC